MKMMKKVAEEEAKEGIRFKIMEVGGRTIKRELQRSNPTATPGCTESDCIACSMERDKGGDCRKNNVNYEIECQLCPEGKKHVYIGETSRNLYTRGKEHLNNNRNRETVGDDGVSFMHRHMEEQHKGQQNNTTKEVYRKGH